MRLACVQTSVTFLDPLANAQRAITNLNMLHDAGVELAVFPEAYLTGYCVDNPAAAAEIAIESSHPSLESIRAEVERLDMLVIMGFAEVQGETLYNTVALVEPGQPTRYYRKTHLPLLGYDRFVEAGEEISVFDTRLGKIGILICFDLRPPEASRVLALAGAELIVLPTNWPNGAQIAAEHMAITRAAENMVFYATCDRVGDENGFHFIGMSKIIGPSGEVLAAAGDQEEIIQADIDMAQARNKRKVVVPGKYETTAFESRRPELYGIIAESESSLVLG